MNKKRLRLWLNLIKSGKWKINNGALLKCNNKFSAGGILVDFLSKNDLKGVLCWDGGNILDMKYGKFWVANLPLSVLEWLSTFVVICGSEEKNEMIEKINSLLKEDK